MESSQVQESIAAIHEEARRRGLFFQTCDDAELHGRRVTVDGREMVSFSSCSYLGLEQDPVVIAGVHDAVDRYGAQFSCSRGYLSAPLYRDLESRLGELFGGHVLVTPSTTMAHLIALPVLATEKDAIVLDHQAHHSIHMGANQARAGGATIDIVRHDQLARACEVVQKLASRHRTVWFATDGVFSMYGDLAPIQALREILAVAPNVRLYVDDAHGMSWAGLHGRGSFLDRFGLSDRVVVATSFAKGFGAGGGCLVFPQERERERVRLSGGPLVFSGPMQPPMMGAVLASAEIHLSPRIAVLQAELRERAHFVNDRLEASGLRPIAINESPIFFVQCGLPRVAFAAAERLAERGIYVNCSVFPTVPMRRAGIRFTITSAHTYEELAQAIDLLAVHVPEAQAAEGLDPDALRGMFADALPAESAGRSKGLHVETADTIRDVDRATWDAVLGAGAACSWEAMRAAERIYGATDAAPEHRWGFRYVLVRDAAGVVVGATVITSSLQKDDMLSREEVSRAVEAHRAVDPYYLTSRVVQLGTNLSEGEHLYLDRSRDWQDALTLILEVAEAEVARAGATRLLVRDCPEGDDALDTFMLDAGLTRMSMFDRHMLELEGDEDTWYRGLDKKKRQQLRPVLAAADAFDVALLGAGLERLGATEARALRGLYERLASRKLRLNVFAFPDSLLPVLANNPAWELGVVRLRPEHGGTGAPLAFWAAHKHGSDYAPLLCGLDERCLEEWPLYRVLLLSILRRARALGANMLHLGMDAELEKRRFGAATKKTCVYVRADEHESSAVLREVVADVAMAQAAT